MRLKLTQLLLIGVFISGLLFSWSVYGQQKQPGKAWEYAVVPVPWDEVSKLNDLGAQGWELIEVRKEEEMLGNVRQVKIVYYLKRPKA